MDQTDELARLAHFGNYCYWGVSISNGRCAMSSPMLMDLGFSSVTACFVLTNDDKLKFVGQWTPKAGLYEAVFSSPSSGTTIEATCEEVMRINPLRLESAAWHRNGAIIPVVRLVSLK